MSQPGKRQGAEPDYQALYNDYWSRPDRVGESSGDLERTASQLVDACGLGSVLDVGSGEGALVSALLRRGVDARGIDVSGVVVGRCNARMPGRFFEGSVLALPFADVSFDTVVSTDCLEHLDRAGVEKGLREIHRVARRGVFLKVATTQDRDGHWHLTTEGRRWWELRCFEAGFRKHPGYYRFNDYEALNHDGWQILILLEKVPRSELSAGSLADLEAERGLHMDMLRDSGERSDAHVVRYQWACDYIKAGDRVLDAACGLGYGAHVIQHLTNAEQVLGIDDSEFAIDYARRSFGGSEDRIGYRVGRLPECLASFEDGAFDAIVSFETLEHVAHPESLLREYHRLLSPGGRIIVSVPNDWSDATGRDPNPHHLQVYDWSRLTREVRAHFVAEEAFAQTASQVKVPSHGNVWERRDRRLVKVDLRDPAAVESEWCLMVAMKSPVGATMPYRERPFRNIAGTGHPSIDYQTAYRNPWLMHGLVNITYRLRNADELMRVAAQVFEAAPIDSNDRAAALCVMAYRLLERDGVDASHSGEMLSRIDEALGSPPPGPMGLRWTVSLRFVKAKILQMRGALEEARAAFEECGRQDVRSFGIHLASRVTESWFWAGKLALALGDAAAARSNWKRGVDYGEVLLSTSLDAILINRQFPNRFNFGDGVREYVVAWDNVARCANGLHLLGLGRPVDPAALDNSFQTEYGIVVRALRESMGHASDHVDDLVRVRADLASRSARLEDAARELKERTRELIEARELAIERTAIIDRVSADLQSRTQELVSCRELLVDRTRHLENAARDLQDRTAELVETRLLLEERTRRLEAAVKKGGE